MHPELLLLRPQYSKSFTAQQASCNAFPTIELVTRAARDCVEKEKEDVQDDYSSDEEVAPPYYQNLDDDDRIRRMGCGLGRRP